MNLIYPGRHIGYLSDNQRLLYMKTILIPVDFGNIARHGADFGM